LSPVGGPDHLGDTNFPVDVSYIYGEKDSDWVRDMEEDFAKGLVDARLKANPSSKSKFHICPTSNHNVHWTNPIGLAHIILNDLLETDLPVLPA
jgi:pimeloyl-ACP methyl ester carboxylesterase